MTSSFVHRLSLGSVSIGRTLVTLRDGECDGECVCCSVGIPMGRQSTLHSTCRASVTNNGSSHLCALAVVTFHVIYLVVPSTSLDVTSSACLPALTFCRVSFDCVSDRFSTALQRRIATTTGDRRQTTGGIVRPWGTESCCHRHRRRRRFRRRHCHRCRRRHRRRRLRRRRW